MPLHRRSKYLWAKRGRRPHHGRRPLKIALFSSLFIIIFWAFFFSPIFRIEKFEVAGVESDERELMVKEIEPMMQGRSFVVFPRNHFLFISKVKQNIQDIWSSRFPSAASVAIALDFPSILQVQVTKRKPVGIWCAPQQDFEKCFGVDEEGIAFTEVEDGKNQNTPRIHSLNPAVSSLGAQVFATSTIKFIATFYKLLRQENFGITDFYEGKTYYEGFRVQVPEGWYIIFLPEGNPEELTANLKLVLDKQLKNKISRLEYIDMRLGDRVFYKLR